ncbi:MAG: TetR-like C-terminal domain-containing protein [Propionibacteriaceae bacterium]|nr:TetR-like C-terminal domain-containing protein [Propionibacteriaceae bacterium]
MNGVQGALFGGKKGLLLALYRQALESFGDAQRAVPETTDPEADLLALGIAYRSWALANPHLFRVMFSGTLPAGDPTCAEAARDTIGPLQAGVARALASGCVVGDHDTIVLSLWSVVHGFATLELDGLLPTDAPGSALTAVLGAALAGWRRNTA